MNENEVNIRFGASIGNVLDVLRQMGERLRGLGSTAQQEGQRGAKGLEFLGQQADRTGASMQGAAQRAVPPLQAVQQGITRVGAAGAVDGPRAAAGIERVTGASRQAEGAVGALAGGLRNFIIALASFQSAKALVMVADAARMAEARMAQVVGTVDRATEASAGLFAMAQRLQAPFAEAQAMFTRMMPAITELQGGTREASALAEVLITTAKLAGASASEAAAGALQFAQAMASGVLQGDELKSLLENNPVLARELAAALGVTAGELKKMGAEGKLTADIVGNALLGRVEDLRAKGAELPVTLGGGLQMVTNAATQAWAEFTRGEGILSTVARVAKEVARVIELITAQFKAAGAQSGITAQDSINAAQAMGKAFAWVADVVDGLIGVIRAAGNMLGGLAAAAQLAMTGDLKGAGAALGDAWRQAGEAGNKLVDGMLGKGKALQGYAALLTGDGLRDEKRGGSEFVTLKGKAKPNDDKDGKGEGKVAAARAALAKAQADAELQVQAEALKAAAALYDAAYSDGLVTLREYYAAREAIAVRGIAAAKAAKEEELASVRSAEKSTTDQAAKLRLQARAAALQGELNALVLREAEAVRAVNAEREQAERALAQRLAEVREQSSLDAAQAGIAAEREALAQRRALNQISDEELFAAERALEARSYAALLANLEARRAAITGSDAQQQIARAQLQAEAEAAYRAHQQRLTQIAYTAEQQRRAATLQTQRGVQQSMQGMFSSLFSGTTKIGDALRTFAANVARTFEEMAAKKLTDKIFDATGLNGMLDRMTNAITGFIDDMVAQWIVGETTKTAATQTAETVKTAAVAAGASTRTATEASASATSKGFTLGDAIASIGAKAWQAAANVYAAISAIPVVGPFLAPAAAVAAGAMVLGFVGKIASSEGGEYRVDQDRLNLVHKNETILPAGFAAGLRQVVGDGGVSPMWQAVQQIAAAVVPAQQQGAQQAGPQGALTVNVSEQRPDPSLSRLQALQAGERVGGGMRWALPQDQAPQIMAAAAGPAAQTGAVGRMAESVQQMAAAGGMRGGDTLQVNVQAVDTTGFKRLLFDNAHHVAAAMKRYGRDGGQTS